MNSITHGRGFESESYIMGNYFSSCITHGRGFESKEYRWLFAKKPSITHVRGFESWAQQRKAMQKKGYHPRAWV